MADVNITYLVENKILEYYCHRLCDSFITHCKLDIESEQMIIKGIMLSTSETGLVEEGDPITYWLQLCEFCSRLCEGSTISLKTIFSIGENLCEKFQVHEDERRRLTRFINTQIVLSYHKNGLARNARASCSKYNKQSQLMYPDELISLVNKGGEIPNELEYQTFLNAMKPFIAAIMKKLGEPMLKMIISQLSAEHLSRCSATEVNVAYNLYELVRGSRPVDSSQPSSSPSSSPSPSPSTSIVFDKQDETRLHQRLASPRPSTSVIDETRLYQSYHPEDEDETQLSQSRQASQSLLGDVNIEEQIQLPQSPTHTGSSSKIESSCTSTPRNAKKKTHKTSRQESQSLLGDVNIEEQIQLPQSPTHTGPSSKIGSSCTSTPRDAKKKTHKTRQQANHSLLEEVTAEKQTKLPESPTHTSPSKIGSSNISILRDSAKKQTHKTSHNQSPSTSKQPSSEVVSSSCLQSPAPRKKQKWNDPSDDGISLAWSSDEETEVRDDEGMVSTRGGNTRYKGKHKIKKSRTSWEEYEIDSLICGVKKYGPSNWAKILNDKLFKFNPKRNSVDLKDKWRNMEKKGIV